MHKWIGAALAAGLVAIAAPAFADTAGYALQAWCVGGFAGKYDKAEIAADGTISATNSFLTPEPWPVVATEPGLAADWLQQAIDAGKGAIDDGPPVYRDGINCGLDLYAPDGSHRPVDLPDIFNALAAYIPPR